MEKPTSMHNSNVEDGEDEKHREQVSLKDDEQINCKNALHLQKPPGAFQTLTALVMLHCPSKGHTQQIALAMVQNRLCWSDKAGRHHPGVILPLM